LRNRQERNARGEGKESTSSSSGGGLSEAKSKIDNQGISASLTRPGREKNPGKDSIIEDRVLRTSTGPKGGKVEGSTGSDAEISAKGKEDLSHWFFEDRTVGK